MKKTLILQFKALVAMVMLYTLVTGSLASEEEVNHKVEQKESKSVSKSDTKVEAKAATKAEIDEDQGARKSALNVIVDQQAIEDLKKSREEFQKRKNDLASKEKELIAKEKAIDEQLKQLALGREEITKLKLSKDKEEEAKVQKVVEMVLSMSPKAAAKMLSTLDDTLSVTVISKMDTERLAKVMNLLSPARASKLSESLAGVVRTNTHSSGDQENLTQSTDRAVAKAPRIVKGGENNGKPDTSRSSETQ